MSAQDNDYEKYFSRNAMVYGAASVGERNH